MLEAQTSEKTGFWRSAGLHLLEMNESGWLNVTPDLIRAYLTRPEIHPIKESCAVEHELFEALMADPHMAVGQEKLAAIADPDARENYEIVLRFRDHLVRHGTLEAAYMALFTKDAPPIPAVFLDQIVHILLRHILSDARDPMRLRAAELFFRDQNVNLDDGRIMLADEEIVNAMAETGGMGSIGVPIMEASTPLRSVQLDVIDDDNKSVYWGRSDRFDTVIDFRFTQPAVDAFARVVEAWIGHFLSLRVRVQPVQSISDERWSWHIGLDSEATRILNALYQGEDVPLEDLQQILALFRMEIDDRGAVIETMNGKPVYLGVAMTRSNKLKLKPQNLLHSLPLRQLA